jgi:hypothetical protein
MAAAVAILALTVARSLFVLLRPQESGRGLRAHLA